MVMNGQVFAGQVANQDHCASGAFAQPHHYQPFWCQNSLLHTVDYILDWDEEKKYNSLYIIEALSHGVSLDFRHYLK